MIASKVTINVANWPEMLFAIRAEMSRRLREEAESESDPRLQRKLHKIADRFEVGQ